MLLTAPPEASNFPVQAFRVKQKKADQVTAFVRAIRASFYLSPSGIRRVVDVGSGMGTLTRELQHQLGLEVIGLDRDPLLVAGAKKMADKLGLSSRSLSFELCDVRHSGALVELLRPGDLVVGLHPCGSLGEDVVAAVKVAGAELRSQKPSLLMVSCCLHGKAWAPVANPRPACSQLGQELGLVLPREALEKANLWAPGSSGATLGSAFARLGLRRLLELRGEPCGPSPQAPSLRGLGRGDFQFLARQALERRGLPPPTASELAAAEQAAAVQLPVFRRLELLTPLVGDVVELAVSLDRAAALEESGYDSALGRLFQSSASPRNLAIYAG
ncbi:unnamed protein product [Polarella glacialis]|uniref:Methyltransferase domain-containing protein n=1 Tax=Polarella glacialis TaxID=89957 RepID=A0A813HZ22_POLGL|nr:unnamed protein product [Polarella glacialis]CAE8644352.1 unnamed protein product [Polarella glacialis]